MAAHGLLLAMITKCLVRKALVPVFMDIISVLDYVGGVYDVVA
jgi:hypothetical protein